MVSFSSRGYDVIVAGGGPAGATTATLCASHGHRVLLVERSPEPAFKVGESLMPATYWTLERLGLLEAMKASGFPRKFSVQFFGPDRAGTPFYFKENDPHESSQTWQVRRADFDQMLLDNAAEKGVEVHRGVALQDVIFDGDRVSGVRLAGDDDEISCRVFVDATGQSAFLGRRLGLIETEPRLKNASYFTHFTGTHRDEGVDGGATLIFHTRERKSWFWSIPLLDGLTSVGVVGAVDYLIKGRDGDPQQVFSEELDKCPLLASRLEGAEQVQPMRAIRDFSYRCRELAGDGWVLVGDAGGFIDPIYSSGVFLALASGEMAADAIDEALKADDPSARRLGAFEDRYRAGAEALRKLVYAFYDPDFSFAAFLTERPHLRRDLINMLVGNVYRQPSDRLVAALDEAATLEPAAT